MSIYIIFTAFMVMMAIAAISLFAYKNRGSWNEFWLAMMLMPLLFMAGIVWLVPRGPVVIAMGLVAIVGVVSVPFVLAAIGGTPRGPEKFSPAKTTPSSSPVPLPDGRAQAATNATIGVWFWILAGVLFSSIVLGILTNGVPMVAPLAE